MARDLSPKYKVTFFQTPTCGSFKEYAIPWQVKLGNITVKQGDGPLPYDDNRELHGITESGSSLLNQTRIVFSVTDGDYNYTLTPPRDFYDSTTNSGGNLTGLIHVADHDIFVNVTVANPGPGLCGL